MINEQYEVNRRCVVCCEELETFGEGYESGPDHCAVCFDDCEPIPWRDFYRNG